MQEKLNELRARLMEISDLGHINALLGWDQSTYMPNGGAPARSRQSALLAQMAQEKAVDPQLGRLLDELQPWAETLPFDSDDASLVRVARREYERNIKVPPAFVGEMVALGAETFSAWTQARPANDFKRMQPYLEKILDNSRRLANFLAPYEHIADPLINYADYGMKAASVRALFAELRKELVPVAQAITSQASADDTCLRQHYPQEAQLAFGKEVVKVLGYDFNRGRLDLTHHPFMTKFTLGDVRITTRVKEDHLDECLFSIIHEGGHAMYEQGIRMELDGSPLGGGTSAGVHESSSRMWENIVGRSRNFWQHFYPQLQAAFPAQLGNVPLETFYRAVNKVERSLIRTEADEVTYNLHVMIRFDLELALLEGSLEVKDLPEAWHARYQSDLGLCAPDDRDGVLQDVHWYYGQIGGLFQGYTLGNVMSGTFYSLALKAHPEIPAEMQQGKFDTLRTWLVENVYQHGSKFTAPELVKRLTGGELTIAPYIDYLKGKYGELYQL
jgi:carboxypeptidase Taq